MLKSVSRVSTLLALLFLLALVTGVGLAVSPVLGSSSAIDQFILDEIAAQGKANLFVKMADDADLNAAYAIQDRVARRTFVYETLKAQAEATQAPVLGYLQTQGIDYTSFWINNSIYVRGANQELVNRLAAMDGVAYLRGDRVVRLDVLTPSAIEDVPADAAPRAIEWGVDRVNAPDVWATGNTGVGMVVANIDTGVRWTHDAIDGQYRGADGNHNYDWWDPDGTFSVPTDNNGHGTHTMGTMVGDDGGANQIGVAPGAKWIAAQGCDGVSCSSFDLTSSAEWIACPTDLNGNNPNCAMAPDVVNNSWGGGGGDAWYQTYVNAWHAAGIVPVFSAGNSGPFCNSLGSPGDYSNVIGVGATNINNKLAFFSSKGPSAFGGFKPNIVSPGDNVRSAWNSSDTAYSNLSGTSMAAPHTSGAVALLLEDTGTASYNDIVNALQGTANTSSLVAPSFPRQCGGIRWFNFPNYIYGYGLMDICAAVDHASLPGGSACP